MHGRCPSFFSKKGNAAGSFKREKIRVGGFTTKQLLSVGAIRQSKADPAPCPPGSSKGVTPRRPCSPGPAKAAHPAPALLAWSAKAAHPAQALLAWSRTAGFEACQYVTSVPLASSLLQDHAWRHQKFMTWAAPQHASKQCGAIQPRKHTKTLMGRSAGAVAAALLLACSLLSAQQAEAGMQDIDRRCKKVLAFFALQTTTIDGALQ